MKTSQRLKEELENASTSNISDEEKRKLAKKLQESEEENRKLAK